MHRSRKYQKRFSLSVKDRKERTLRVAKVLHNRETMKLAQARLMRTFPNHRIRFTWDEAKQIGKILCHENMRYTFRVFLNGVLGY